MSQFYVKLVEPKYLHDLRATIICFKNSQRVLCGWECTFFLFSLSSSFYSILTEFYLDNIYFCTRNYFIVNPIIFSCSKNILLFKRFLNVPVSLKLTGVKIYSCLSYYDN